MKCLDFDWQINEFMVYCRSTQLRERSMASYNNGYLYEMDDYTCYITHEEGTWERNKIGTSRGQRPELPPLMRGTYQVFLPAIDLIETDTEAPLRIVVRLPASNGTQAFTYLVRG